jgi:hypothetical protein
VTLQSAIKIRLLLTFAATAAWTLCLVRTAVAAGLT